MNKNWPGVLTLLALVASACSGDKDSGTDTDSPCLGLGCNPDSEETETPAETPDTPEETVEDTPADTPSDTPADTPADTPVDTATDTETLAETESPSDTPTGDSDTVDTTPPVVTLAVADLQPGDLVITELQVDPVECTLDSRGEYVEIWNATPHRVALNGLKIATLGFPAGSTVSTNFVLEPGEHAVGVSNNPSRCPTTAPELLTPDFTYATSVAFNNAGEAVSIKNAAQTIDTVDYRGWALIEGRSLSLTGVAYSLFDNDAEGNWCYSDDTLSSLGLDFGTPGFVVSSCYQPPADTPTGDTSDSADTGSTGDTSAAPGIDTDRGDVIQGTEVLPGELVITEVMINGTDCADAEKTHYVEVYNASTLPMELQGLELQVGGSKSIVSYVGQDDPVLPGEYVTLWSQAGACYTSVEREYDYRERVVLSQAIVRVNVPGGVTIDEVRLGQFTIPTAASLSLRTDAGPFDATTNNSPSAWCVSESLIPGASLDKGTPGEANVCPAPDTGSSGGGGDDTPGGGGVTCPDNGVAGLQSDELRPGDLMITEVMLDPAGNDSRGQYVEVLNTTAENIFPDGLLFYVGGGSATVRLDGVDPVIPPGARSILWRAPGTAFLYPVDPQFKWVPSSRALLATNIRLEGACGLVDEVDMTGWVASTGASFELSEAVSLYGEPANDDLSDWCVATALMGSTTEKGTPDTVNTCGQGGGGPGGGGVIDTGGGPPGDGSCRDLQDHSDGIQADELCPGDLLLSEVLFDIGPTNLCTNEERITFVEVVNATAHRIYPDGMFIRVGTSSGAIEPKNPAADFIEPGGYGVLTKAFIGALCGTYERDFTWSSFALRAAPISIEAGVEVIDSVDFTGWFIPIGSSLSVRPEIGLTDPLDNDFESTWCEAAATPLAGFEDIFASPGAANACRYTDVGPVETDNPDYVPPLTVGDLGPGDLAITELMEDPNCSARTGEYIEIENTSGREVDLNGLKIKQTSLADNRIYTVVVGRSLPLADGERALVARSSDADCYAHDVLFSAMRLHDTLGNQVELINESNLAAPVVVDLVNTNPASFNVGARLRGQSLQFGAQYDAVRDNNAAGGFWCLTQPDPSQGYSDGGATDYGTPRNANGPCLDDTGRDTDNAPDRVDSANDDTGFLEIDPDVSIGTLQAGDIVITEVMITPVGCGEEARGEYFEVFNNTDLLIDLDGMIVLDEDSSYEIAQTALVPPRGYYTFQSYAAGLSRCIDLGPTFAGYQNDPFDNERDQLILRRPDGVELDRVELDFANSAGASWQLDPTSAMSTTANDARTAWCLAGDAIPGSGGNLGTPNAANVCAVEVVPDACAGDLLCASEMTAGSLVITEVQVDPSVCLDPDAEFFEVFNPSGVPVRLTGLRFQTLAGRRGSFTVRDEVQVLPRTYAVFGRGNVERCYGVVPDVVYTGSILNNRGDLVEVVAGPNGDTVVDRVDFRGWNVYRGRSMQLSSTTAFTDVVANDDPTHWCPSLDYLDAAGIDRGTPGTVNYRCEEDLIEPPAPDDTPVEVVPSDSDNPVDTTPFEPPPGTPALGASNLVEGDIILTEAMIRPLDPCPGNPVGAEYIELFNTLDVPVDLAGLTITTRTGLSFTLSQSVVVGPRRLAVGRRATDTPCYAFEADFTFDSILLTNVSEVLTLRNAQGVIDTVTFDFANGFEGRAWSLDPAFFDGAGNDVGDHWCEAVPFIAGSTLDHGTPGEPNWTCPGAAPEDTPVAPDTAAPVVETGDTSTVDFVDLQTGDPISTLVPGDLILTEIMVDPRDCSDNQGEFIEIYNRSGRRLNLDGLRVSDGSREYIFERPDGRFSLAPDQFMVLTRQNVAPCYGFVPDDSYAAVVLGAPRNLVYVANDAAVLDAVDFTGWDFRGGRSMQLSPDRLLASPPSGPIDLPGALTLARDYVNDDSQYWCESWQRIPGTASDKGTPGVANLACPAAGTLPPYPPGYVAHIDELDGGELVLTEMMVDPTACDDVRGEWIELTSVADFPVSLAGMVIRFGTTSFEVQDNTIVFPGDVFIGRRVSGAECNTLLPSSFTYSLVNLPSLGGEIQIRNGHSLLDAMDYTGLPVEAGVSLSLDPNSWSAASNDDGGSWCGGAGSIPGALGERGSPTQVNDTCSVGGGGPSGAPTVSVNALTVGDLVITEYLDATEPCGSQEQYVEVFNRRADAVDLNGLRLRSNAPGFTTLSTSVIVQPGGYVVLQSNSLSACLSIEEDARFTNYTFDALPNVRLEVGTTIIDSVDFGAFPTPLEPGRARQLTVASRDAASNNDPAAWCDAQIPLPNTPFFGTPGADTNCDVVVDTGGDSGSSGPPPIAIRRVWSAWRVEYASQVYATGTLERNDGYLPFPLALDNPGNQISCSVLWNATAVQAINPMPAACPLCSFAFEFAFSNRFDNRQALMGVPSSCPGSFDSVGGIGPVIPNIRLAFSPVDRVYLWQSQGQWLPYVYASGDSITASSFFVEREIVPPTYYY
jgi:hypothetical protein